MKYELMALPEIARYLGVSPSPLGRAYCNRKTLGVVPLPEPLNHVSFSQRYWSREEVRQFRHTLQRVRYHA